MKFSTRKNLSTLLPIMVTTFVLPAQAEEAPFEPNWESLERYECPEWFRDAKFGIWAHWGPQCEPERGDWYGRNMYIEKTSTVRFTENGIYHLTNGHYKHHIENYGHPSEFGFKDVINEWKAENFDPDALLSLYKECGARYFMAMANHHENFDNFNSKHQPWNSVNVGPKKDLIGMWKDAAHKYDLRFAVSVHASHAWNWYEIAQGADTEGPYAGIPYDGAHTKADGKGKWWEGLDPQDLYEQNHTPGTGWLEWDYDPAKGSSTPDKAYMDKFYNRVTQLWDDYQPDQIYFDDFVLPFAEVDPSYGLRLAAHFYNTSIQQNGTNEAVMNAKFLSESQRKALVFDAERSKAAAILPEPWQTDTCIGQWHYNSDLYSEHGYAPASSVVPMLVDIVSKNGNLMLNLPLRGDGTLDSDEVAIIKEIGAWLKINGDAIYATRPWKVFGEGPAITASAGGHGVESDLPSNTFTSEDIRFTRSKDGSTIYAIVLAWPDNGQLTIKSLATTADTTEDIDSASLFGYDGEIEITRDTQGLHLQLPTNAPCDHAYAIKLNKRQ